MRAVTLGMSPEQTVHGVFGAPKVGRKRRRVLCWYSGGVAPRSGRFSQDIYEHVYEHGTAGKSCHRSLISG